jgi:hypothetical protein
MACTRLLPAGATCQNNFERARGKSSAKRSQTVLSISITNAAFYAARCGVSTAGRTRGAYAFAGKQLGPRGKVSEVRIWRDIYMRQEIAAMPTTASPWCPIAGRRA